MVEERLIKCNLCLLEMAFSKFDPAYFGFRLWNGQEWDPAGLKEKRATVVINNPRIMADILFLPTDLRMGEAYIHGDIEFEGDVYSIFPVEEYLYKRYRELALNPLFWRTLLTLKRADTKFQRLQGREKAQLKGKLHSIERDRKAISYHYDVSNGFYSLWLDRLMNYSCAYFRSPDEDLDTAQRNKLELICRKLRLKEGEKVLDIGCGWGGFMVYAAKRYGVKVLGITLSQNQVEYVKKLIESEGLKDLLEVRYQDYREVKEPESFDKLVSIGMFEHVGKRRMREYFKQAYTILRPQGLFLNHGIAAKWSPLKIRSWSFTERYVFPDGHLLPISGALKVAEDVGFEVRDVESLREHYALTLRHWVGNLERHREEALKEVDEVTYRVWKLHMSGASYGFEKNRTNVYQALLVKSGKRESSLPLTREEVYRDWR